MDGGEKGTSTTPDGPTKDVDEEDVDKTQLYIPATADAGQINSGNTNEKGNSSSLDEIYHGILNIKEEYQEMLEYGIESDSEQAMCESCGNECNATLLDKCNVCFKSMCEVCSQNHTSEDHTRDTEENVDESSEKRCEPCKYVKKQTTASKRCEDCDEILCDSCILSHKAQKVTRSHVIVDIVAQLKTKCKKHCEPCTFKGVLDKEASFVCTDCEEYLCYDCKLVHKKLKLTRDHNVKEINLTAARKCEPCLENGTDEAAEKFCKVCQEYLCGECFTIHRSMKATRDHTVCDIQEVPIHDNKNDKMCEPCKCSSKANIATHFCSDCEELLCLGCMNHHQKLKATKLHVMITVDEYQRRKCRKLECGVCKEGGTNKEAVAFCIDCDPPELICSDCMNHHKAMKATRRHTIETSLEKYCHQEEEKKIGDVTTIRDSRHERVLQDRLAATNYGGYQHAGPSRLGPGATNFSGYQHAGPSRLGSGATNSDGYEYVRPSRLGPGTTYSNRYQYAGPSRLGSDAKNFSGYQHAGPSRLGPGTTYSNRYQYAGPSRLGSDAKNFSGYQHAGPSRLGPGTTYSHGYEHAGPNRLRPGTTNSDRYQHAGPSRLGSDATNSDGYQHAGPSRLGSGATNFSGYQYAGPRRLGPGATNSDGYEHAGPSRLGPGATNSDGYEHAGPSRLRSGATNYYEYQHAGPSSLGPGATNSDGYQHTGPSRLGSGATNSDRYQHTGPSRLGSGATNFGCKEAQEGWQNTGARGSRSPPGSKRKLQVDSITNKKTKFDKLKASKTLQVNLFQPGKPRANDKPKADSIHLSWNPPHNFYDEYRYQIRYKTRSPSDKWKFYEEMYKNSSVILKNLQSNTTFVFQVRMVNHEGEGPYGDPSDEITTQQSAANHLIEFSHILTNLDGVLEKMKIPLEEDKRARNSKVKTRRFNLGNPSKMPCKEKTILLVGATGSGKSTLVDGFINYILGVNWDDPFRFTLIDLEEEERGILQNQAVSQTHWITTYCINPINGSRIDYKLNIIDTPGFGDTQGFERDQQIIDQIRHLFSATDETGVVFLDSICFLAKAPDARLTPSQKYIFNAILSLFGQDIADNINVLITFADGKTPPVLAALKEAQVPHGGYFPFNNSGLYADNAGPDMSSLSPMFWEMGYKSFADFFEHLKGMQTKSLKQTKEVLARRHQLEVTIENLSPLVSNGLNKLDELREEIRILEQHKTEIEANKNFVYTVTETKQVKKALPYGLHVTNCLHCNITCHKECYIPKDEDKDQCWAMDCCGNCTQCSEKCHWSQHANTPYIFEYKQEEKTKSYAEKEEKYRSANGEKMTHEKVIIRMGVELEDMEVEILILMSTATECNNILKQIALRPNPLSIKEHIDLLIEGEKLEKRPGFQKRISALQEFRKKANIGEDVSRFRESLVDARSHSTFHAETEEKIQGRKRKNVFGFLFEDIFGLRNPVESGSNDNA